MASFLTTLYGLSTAHSGLTGAPAAGLPVGVRGVALAQTGMNKTEHSPISYINYLPKAT